MVRAVRAMLAQTNALLCWAPLPPHSDVFLCLGEVVFHRAGPAKQQYVMYGRKI